MALISATELRNAQLDAEGEMVDVCEIRAVAVGVFNPTTGAYDSTPGALIYPETGRQVGICKRQSSTARFEATANAGGRAVTESRIQMHIPASAPRIPTGAIVTVIACRNDPHSVGQKFHVDGPAGKTWPTAQRFNVTEVVG